MNTLSALSVMIDPRVAESRYWMVGLGMSVMIHLALLQGLVMLDVDEKPMTTIIWPVKETIHMIPSINPSPPGGTRVRTNVPDGVPVPVADLPPDRTLPTNGERGTALDPVGDLPGEGGAGGTAEVIPPPPDEEPPIFRYVEKYPVVIRSVVPEYPPLAVGVGLEGRVWVKIWVDANGRARKAVVLKSDAEIFEAPAVKAAMEFLFTPAVMNGNPVSVWVSIPFQFRLKG